MVAGKNKSERQKKEKKRTKNEIWYNCIKQIIEYTLIKHLYLFIYVICNVSKFVSQYLEKIVFKKYVFTLSPFGNHLFPSTLNFLYFNGG